MQGRSSIRNPVGPSWTDSLIADYLLVATTIGFLPVYLSGRDFD